MYHKIQPERVKICCYTQPELWHCPIFPGFTNQSRNTLSVCLELHVIDTEGQIPIEATLCKIQLYIFSRQN